MDNIKIFENSEFGEIRTVTVDNEPMFCLADVCKALEIRNVSDCRNRLNEAGVVSTEVGVQTGVKADGTPAIQKVKMNFINESNLYKTIFQSRKESAERFTDWVTSEVLPSIRKNGGYINNQENLTSEQILANAVLVAQNVIAEKDRQIERMKPKEIFADAVSASETSILVGELAKILKQNGVDTGEKRLFAWMKENGYLMSRVGSDKNIPTQKSMNLGLFEIKETIVSTNHGSKVKKTPKVTGKGQQYFINKFLNNGIELKSS